MNSDLYMLDSADIQKKELVLGGERCFHDKPTEEREGNLSTMRKRDTYDTNMTSKFTDGYLEKKVENWNKLQKKYLDFQD